MDKVKQAYRILSQISVSGDAIDVIAAVRSLLRDCIQEVDNGRQADKQSTGGDKR